MSNTVVLLRGVAGSETARLVGVNATDGSTRWTGAPGDYTGWPAPCPDDTTAVCATGSLGGSAETQLIRLAGATGHELPSPVISTNSAGRDLGPGLFDPATRTPDLLVAVTGGSVAWRRPLASVFDRSGVSTDNGWNFDRIPATGLFVGSVSGPPLSHTDTSAVIDLASGATAGFRISDGTPVWHARGSDYLCNILPCSGPAHPAGTGTAAPPVIGIRLRGTGTLHVAESKAPVFSPGAKLTLEGFDLRTGRTLWSLDAGHDLSLVEGTTPPQISEEKVVLPGAGGTLTSLDLMTGERGKVATGTTLWCQTNTTYKVKTPRTANNGQSSNTYQGQNATFSCDEHKRAIAPPSHVPAFVGPSINGTIAWSETNKVVAAPGT